MHTDPQQGSRRQSGGGLLLDRSLRSEPAPAEREEQFQTEIPLSEPQWAPRRTWPEYQKPEYQKPEYQKPIPSIPLVGPSGGDDGGDDDPDEHDDRDPEHKRRNAFGGQRSSPNNPISRGSGNGSGGDGGDFGNSELDDDKKWRAELATIPPQYHYYLMCVLRAARLVNFREQDTVWPMERILRLIRLMVEDSETGKWLRWAT